MKDQKKQPCMHARVDIYSRLECMQTLEQPAEYTVWGICKDCGDYLTEDEIPEEAVEFEPDPEFPGIPHEFYD